jgi:hypothetical protein
MPITYAEIEDRVTAAVADLRQQQKPNISATARKYNAPRKRVSRRLKSDSNKINSSGQNKRLLPAEEEALRLYIDRMDNFGVPVREFMITQAANTILSRTSDPTPVGPGWTGRWLQRNPEYLRRKQKPLAATRKNTHNPEDIQKWYNKLEAVIKSWGVQNEDIYNMDETGFRIGVGRAHEVITRVTSKRRYLSDPDNRDYITSIECICASGKVLPSLIIIKAASLQERWIVDELAPDNSIAYSDSGYSNDDINLAWIKHFDRVTVPTTIGAFRLLILDGFNSHNEYDFISYSTEHRIILFTLPPHTTHFLQPLDVVCFQPLKHYHAEAIDKAVHTGDTEFTKVEFLAAFDDFRAKTFTVSTVQSAFRQTGLVPFNPKRVIEAMQEKIQAQRDEEAQEVTSEEEIGEELDPDETPIAIRTVIRYAEALEDDIYNAPISPTLQTRISKYIKGSLARVHSGAQAELDLEMTQLAEAARAVRRKSSQRTILQGGVLSVKEARVRIKQRANVDNSVLQARLNRVLIRDQRAYQKVLDIAVAIARERIRRLDLRKEFGLDF